MKKTLSLLLCWCAMACFAANTVDTVQVSIQHPSYFAYSEENAMWTYTGETTQSGKRYVFTLEWYAPAEDMTGTFTGEQIAEYTYNGGLIISNMPKLATEIVAEVTGSRDTAVHILTTLKAISGIYATDTTMYIINMLWTKPNPKDTFEHVVPKGELVMKDSAIFRGEALDKWVVSVCYDNYITYFGEKTPGHVFDKNTFVAYNQDTITPLSSPSAVITLDENRMYHLTAEIFGTDENLHIIKLDAPVPAPTDTADVYFDNWELQEANLPDEWGCQAFGEEYQVEIYIQTGEIASGTYKAQQVYAYVTEILPSGAYLNYSAVYAEVETDIRDTCRFVTADLQCENGRLYHVSMEYRLPVAKDTVELTFQNMEFYDNIAFAQNVTFLGYTADSLYYLAMNLYTNEIPDGTYTQKDVYRSFILHYLDEPGGESTQGFMLYGTVDVEFDGVDSMFVHGEMLCTDSVFYRFDFRTAYSVSQHLEGDTEEGELVREYDERDYKEIEIRYFHQLTITSRDFKEQLVLWMSVEEDDPDIVIAPGVYPIDGTSQYGTVYASTGIDFTQNSISPSFFASLISDEEGNLYYSDPFYFIVDGTVTVEKKGTKMRLVVDGENSFGVKVYIVYDEIHTDLTSVREDAVGTSKHLQDGQLIIRRGDKSYTVLGVSVE
ncbi:MAG: hypothetical protein ACI4BD_08235 [Paludibacteraceae bacterium]